MMRYLYVFLLGFFSLAFAQTTKLTIFSLNPYLQNVSAVSNLLQKERQKADHHLTLLPSLEKASLYGGNFQEKTQNYHQLLIDVAVVSFLEKDNEEKIASSIASNPLWVVNCVVDEEQNFPKASQVMIYECEGIKIGIFAIGLEKEKSIQKRENVFFLPTSFAVHKTIKNLKKKGAEIILAISHQSLEKDLELLQHQKEIDIIIGCHDDNTISSYEDEVLVYKINKQDKHLSRIDLTIEKKCLANQSEIKVYPCCLPIPIPSK